MDDRDDDGGPSMRGKRSVKTEEKSHEGAMQDVMARFNKISESDLSRDRTMWPP